MRTTLRTGLPAVLLVTALTLTACGTTEEAAGTTADTTVAADSGP
ncbi:hypothetical protein NKG05_29655 [Oerskovia sp. M15]